MQFQTIVYDKGKKGIFRVTINRPDVRNALNSLVRQEIRQVVEDINKDNDVRVVIITGAGDKAFIAGADVTDFKDMTPIAADKYVQTLGQQLYTDIENLKVPVIAMINGYCFGGGLEVAMCCDIRIASPNAKFGQLEINVGLMPGGGATQRLPKLVGWGRAKELIYTGKVIDSTEAERIGLVDRVVPQEKLEMEVNQIAETIVSKSPLLIQMAKKAINRGMYTDMAAGLDYERTSFALCFATEDRLEGVTAFLEKRTPEFRGK